MILFKNSRVGSGLSSRLFGVGLILASVLTSGCHSDRRRSQADTLGSSSKPVEQVEELSLGTYAHRESTNVVSLSQSNEFSYEAEFSVIESGSPLVIVFEAQSDVAKGEPLVFSGSIDGCLFTMRKLSEKAIAISDESDGNCVGNQDVPLHLAGKYEL